MRIRGNVDGPYREDRIGTGRGRLDDDSDAGNAACKDREQGELRGGVAPEMTRRWTLIRDGVTKLYVLREYHKVGIKWYRISMLEYTELETALAKIRAVEAEDARR